MPSFKELDQIKDHAKYKAELKTALRTAAGKKFLYFKKHKLTPGRNHLLVVDCDLGISKMLGTPSAEGKCVLNEAKQLVMEPTKGTLKVRPVKKYVEGFYTEREIWVSADEPEEIEEDDTKTIAAQVQPGVAAPVPPAKPAEPPKKFPSTPPPAPPGSATKPAVATATTPKPSLGQTLASRPQPPPTATMPGSTQTTQQTAAQIPVGSKPAQTLPTRPPPPSTPPTQPNVAPSLGTKPPIPQQLTGVKPTAPAPSNTDQVRKERRLSTYMTGKRIWREARVGAQAELQRLEKVIVDSCNGELFASDVAEKTKQLFGLIAQMDDSIGDRLDQASTMEDPERQAHLHKQVLSVVQKNRSALKGNPLAGVVDDNPFGKFSVRAQLDSVLAKLETDFS